MKEELRDAYYYQAEILHNYIALPGQSYEEIQSLYDKALTEDPGFVDGWLAQCKFFFFYSDYFILKPKKEEAPQDEEDRISKRIHCHVEGWRSFRRGTDVITKKPDDEKSPEDFSQLGSFYLLIGQYEDASEHFKNALASNKNLSTALVGLGVAQSKMQDFEEAIGNFQRALALDPNDLDTKSNLADACLNAQRFSIAEGHYRSILKVTPYHVDASIGLANFFKLKAVQALTNKDSEAEEYLTKAIKQYNEIVYRDENKSDQMSRRLLPQDRNSINYSLGYCRVELYKIKGSFGIKFLRTDDLVNWSLEMAREDFRKITEGDSNFFEAQNAIQKINKEKEQTRLSKVSNLGPVLIIGFALIMCVGAQYLFFVGREEKRQVFSIDHSAVTSTNTNTKIDSVWSNISILEEQDFVSLADMKNAIDQIAPSEDFFPEAMKQGLIQKKERKTREPISETSYTVLTFGGLIFIVVGFFLKQISKFKVGSIEVEKVTSDTISTTSNLAVSKGTGA